jgi:hypothetical protein
MADYTSVIQDLANATWRRLSKDDIPGVNAREIARVFPRDSDADGDNIITFLDTYVDLANHTANTPLPYVDSPKMENVTYPGRWRLVSNGYNRSAGGYVQVLRLGWATAIDIAECHIQSGTDSRSDARSYVFLWRNIASSAVNACVESLRTTASFTNPTIQGEEKTGTYSMSEITPQQQADGSYWITVNCLKVASIATIADIAALTPVRKDTHDIENPFGLEGGYTTHVGRKPTDGIVLTYRALSMASRAVIMALTDDALQGLLGVADQAKFEFIKRDLSEDSGNTLTLMLAYQYIPLAVTITAESARYVGMERKNQSNKIIIEISWPRIDPTAIGTISEDALYKRDTVTDLVVEGITYMGEYFVNTTTAPMTDNDGIRIVQKMTKAGDQKLDLIIGKDPDHKIYEFWRWDISAADIAEFMAETGGELHDPKLYNWGTPQIGTTKMVDVNKQADESFILHAIYSDTKDLDKHEFAPLLASDPDGISGTPLEVQESFGKTTQNAYGWNIPIAYLRQFAAYFKPAVAVVNQRNKFTISRQTEHVFDFQGERETFVMIDSGYIEMEDTDFKTVKIRGGSYVPLASLSGTPNEGTKVGIFGPPDALTPNHKYEQAFKENDMGSFDGQTTWTIFKEVDSKDVIIEGTKVKTVTKREGEYLLDATIAAHFARPTYVAGTEVELKITPNDVQTHSATIITTVYHDQTNVTTETDASRSVTKTEHTAIKATDIVAPTPAEGHIVSLVKDERPDGLIKAVAVDETEEDQTAAGGKSSLLEEVVVDAHTSGPTVAVSGGAQNVDVDVVEAPTKGGRKQTKKVTSRLNPWSSAPSVVSDDGIVKVSQTLFKNQTSAPFASTNEEVKLGDNDRGGFNGAKLTKALSTSASGSKSVHMSSVVDWDISKRELRTPTWNTYTNGDVDAYITGYNNWLVSMSRTRIITTIIKKSYSLTEPTSISVTVATPGESEGEGTSYFKDVRKEGDAWATTEKSVGTSAWGAWGRKNLTWINYIQTTVGTGS